MTIRQLKRKSLILALLLTCAAPAYARVATGSSGNFFQARMFDNQKQAAKEGARWTLADWLAQKQKMEWWDNWLVMNRSVSIFEMVMSGAHNKYTLTSTDSAGVETETEHDAQVYNLDLYVTLFDLYGEYERTSNSQESWGGGLGLRLFGTQAQGSSLLVRYGWRKLNRLDTQEKWENQWAEGELQISVFHFFGVQGRYRKIFSNKSNLGNSLEGSRTTAGAFIDIYDFRIYGDVYTEPLEFKDSSEAVTKETRKGYEAGLKIYF